MTTLLLRGLVGCDNQGPAEEADESIDEALESAGEGIEEMGFRTPPRRLGVDRILRLGIKKPG